MLANISAQKHHCLIFISLGLIPYLETYIKEAGAIRIVKLSSVHLHLNFK